MERTEAVTCTAVRVTRRDTVLIRAFCPQIQSSVSTYLVLEGVKCSKDATACIEDWLDLHGEQDRFRLTTWQWFRDQYGRVLGDLCDISSGECLTDHLIEQGVATHWPDHYLSVLRLQGGDPC
jgi:hypothetical protein